MKHTLLKISIIVWFAFLGFAHESIGNIYHDNKLLGGGPPASATITSFTPSCGVPGSVVSITGTNFTSSTVTSVTVNGVSASFLILSTTQISVTVPASATTGVISVSNGTTTVNSSTSYAVSLLTSFSPSAGLSGASVVLTGTNFTGATSVKFNGVSASYTVNSATQITAVVPVTATTGKINIVTPTCGTIVSATNFTVSTGSITSFTPTCGFVGTSVTITGAGFTGVTGVKFNGVSASSYTVNSASEIIASIPTGATTGVITIVTSAGNINSAASINISNAAITSFTPSCASAGTSVTIAGSGFTGATSVMFNGITSTFTVNSATQITATVPSGTTTGLVSVTVAGGCIVNSASNFTVPSFTSFTPTWAPPGSSIILNGSGFTGTTAVTFNGVTASSYTVNSDSKITVIVPSGATTGSISITSPCASLSKSGFTVTTVCSPLAYVFSSSTGGTGSAKGKYDQPSGIAVSSSGFKYISDAQNHRVQVGATTWGVLGTNDGEFNTPSGIVLSPDETLLYVTDKNNNRVQVFDIYGNYQSKWGTAGNSNVQLSSPTGIAVDNTGNVYVCDNGNNRIQKYTSTGVYLSTIGTGTSGNANGQFNSPIGVAVDNAGNIFVTDNNNNRVQKFNSSGTYVSQWFINSPCAIAVDGSGGVLVADVLNNLVQKFTNSGTYVTQFGQGLVTHTNGIAVDQSCTVYTVGNDNLLQVYASFTPPIITSFTPSCGAAGTQVVITGSNFTSATGVTFNGVTASYVINSSTQITATLPSGASTGYISVSVTGGSNVSSSVFTVSKISSFTSSCGIPGSSVVITGSNFTGSTAVKFNGLDAASYVVNSSTQITAVVPVGATSGKISVTTTCGTAISITDYTVLTLSNTFTPACAVAGTSVVLTGTGFTGATAVSFNGTNATSFTVNSATQITAVVPAGAVTGPLSVTNSCGTVTSTTNFIISGVNSILPTCGAAGTIVTLNGSNFTGATAVKFNGVDATSFTVNSATQITATVPAGAGTGSISVVTNCGTVSSATFNVLTISNTVTPACGIAGTSVTLTGTNFTGATAVKFNGIDATSFTVNSATQITATVPAGNAQGLISVTTSCGTASTTSVYTVLSIDNSLTPSCGIIGTSVTITGTNFTGVTAVKFNNTDAASFTVNSATQITATVPAGAVSGSVSVTNSCGTIASTLPYSISDISSFTPSYGTASGSVITINGSGFTGATAVKFNGVNATSFTVVSPTQITATTPSGISTGLISVTTPCTTVNSTSNYTFGTVSSFTPSSGAVGTKVTITGSGFSNVTSVSFNGIITKLFIVNSATEIIAVVPNTATTGVVTVNMSGGISVTSAAAFTVTAPTALMCASVNCQTYSHVKDLGEKGTSDGQFTNPWGMAVDASGNIYVADYSSNRIQKFSNDGTFLLGWGGPGTADGKFDSPTSIAIDAFDNIYIVDNENNRVQKFDKNGVFITKWGSLGNANDQLNNPADIAVDYNGNVFVTDVDNNRVVKYDQNGTYITKWGSLGTGNYGFNAPYGIGTDISGNVYVTDYNNNRIQIFYNDGLFKNSWGQSGTWDVQFSRPVDIVVDNNNNTYVVDNGNKRVQKITTDGTYITELANWAVNGEYFRPQCITLDALCNMYITDLGSSNIHVYEPISPVTPVITSVTPSAATRGSKVIITGSGFTGARLVAFQGGVGSFFEINSDEQITVSVPYNAYDTNDPIYSGTEKIQVYFACMGSNYIESPSGFTVLPSTCTSSSSLGYDFTAEWGSCGTGADDLSNPSDVAIDAMSNVFVCDKNNHRISKFSNDGTLITQWDGDGENQFSDPVSVAVDYYSGEVYVLDHGYNRIQKFTNNGHYIKTIYHQGSDPYAISVGGYNIYVTDYTGNCVYLYPLDGSNYTKWGTGIAGNSSNQFNHPTGIFADVQTGKTFIVDNGNHRILEYGTYNTNQWGTNTPGNYYLPDPRKITMDGIGNFYVTDGTNFIKKFTHNGTYISTFGNSGASDASFDVPEGIAIGPNCELYVSDKNNCAIKVLSPDNIPRISITSPTSESVWATNDSQTITWINHNVSTSDNVKIELYNGTSWITIASSVPNSGTYTYTPVPFINVATSAAKIRITDLTVPSIVAMSNLFQLNAPTLTVTSPATGILWTSNTTATVTWTSQNLLPGEGVTIDLIDEFGIGHFLTFSADNGSGGSVTVNVPNWLKPIGTAKVHVYLSFHTLIGDYSDEFTVAPACAATITSYPYNEGFESGLGIWNQSTDDNFDWTLQTGATPSNYTGPDAAYEGSYYLYTEGDAPNVPSKEAVLFSSCFNFSSLTSPQLRFWYHMYGYGMGTLQVQVSEDRGGNWSTVFTESGDHGNVWNQAVINLSSYSGKTILIRFTGATAWVFSSDMAIDNIWVGEKPNPCSTVINSFPYNESFESGIGTWTQNTNDDADWVRQTGATPNAFTGPDAAESGSYYMFIPSGIPNQNVKSAIFTSPCYDISAVKYPELRFWYHMYGTYMGEMTLQISTDGGTTWESEPLWSESGDQGNVWHEKVIDLTPHKTSGSFKFRFTGTTVLITQNDMAIDNITIQNANPCQGNAISTFPYTESFENTFGVWTVSTDVEKRWVNTNIPTPQPITGPDAAKDGSYYVFVDSYDPYVPGNQTAILTSGCFDLTTTTSPVITFWYHMFGAPIVGSVGMYDTGMGTMSLQISDNNGSTWETVWTKSGDQGDVWYAASVDLSAYQSSPVRFRFTGTTADSRKSDMAIDGIGIGGQSITVTSPVSSTNWEFNTSQLITWNSFGILSDEKVTIEFYNGSTWVTLATDVSNDGSESILIPNTLYTVTNAQIRVSLSSNTTINGSSPAFTVTVPMTFTITSPSSGTNWASGSTQTVTWINQGVQPSENVKIEIFDGVIWQLAAASVANTGSRSITVPSVSNTVNNAAVRITLLSNTSVTAQSSIFTIGAPSITITSPVSGSVTAGATVTVQWTSVNLTSAQNVSIRFHDGTSWNTLLASTPNDGSQAVTLPTGICTVVSSVVFEVCWTTNPSITDYSPSLTFNPAQSVTLTSPTSSTVWTSAATGSVTWTTCGITSSTNMKIEFYNGSAWSTVLASTLNDGSETITVPNVTTSISTAKIRVSMVSNSAVTSSSTNFTVNNAMCAGNVTVTGTSGTITDGSGTGNYGNNMNCYFYFNIPAGKDFYYRVNALSIDNRYDPMNTGYHVIGGVAKNDYDGSTINQQVGDVVMVFEGSTLYSSITYFGTFSAPGGWNSMGSSGQSAVILFHTDNTVTGGGFTIDWKFITAGTSPRNGVFDEDEQLIDFNLYPNPASDVLTIEPTLYTEDYTIKVINTVGEIVIETTGSSVKELDLSALVPGVYSVQIQSGSQLFTKKVIHIK